MAQKQQRLAILGNNDTAYRLYQLLSHTQPTAELAYCSTEAYCPNSCFPELLAGSLSLQEACLAVPFVDPEQAQSALIIDAQTDPQYVTVMHLPEGRRRYFLLNKGSEVVQANQALQAWGGLVTHGSSLNAVLYATAVAEAGMTSYLVKDHNSLVHRHFDQMTHDLIRELLENSGVILITKAQAKEKNLPALFTPFSDKGQGLVRARQQLKNDKTGQHSNYRLPDGGDWYQLPELALEQLANKLGTRSAFPLTSYGGAPNLPHRISIQNFDLHYAGSLHPDHKEECLTMSIPEQGIYRKIIVEGDRITGFLLAGDVSGSDTLTDMMLTHKSIQHCRDELLFVGRKSVI